MLIIAVDSTHQKRYDLFIYYLAKFFIFGLTQEIYCSATVMK